MLINMSCPPGINQFTTCPQSLQWFDFLERNHKDGKRHPWRHKLQKDTDTNLLVTWMCFSSIIYNTQKHQENHHLKLLILSQSRSRLLPFQGVSSAQTAWHPAIKSAHFCALWLYSNYSRLQQDWRSKGRCFSVAISIKFFGSIPVGIQVTIPTAF